jgi:hypothetical protein
VLEKQQTAFREFILEVKTLSPFSVFSFYLFCFSGGVLAPHQTDNATIRQDENNFPRLAGKPV